MPDELERHNRRGLGCVGVFALPLAIVLYAITSGPLQLGPHQQVLVAAFIAIVLLGLLGRLPSRITFHDVATIVTFAVCALLFGWWQLSQPPEGVQEYLRPHQWVQLFAWGTALAVFLVGLWTCIKAILRHDSLPDESVSGGGVTTARFGLAVGLFYLGMSLLRLALAPPR
jgi:hypothetical protein